MKGKRHASAANLQSMGESNASLPRGLVLKLGGLHTGAARCPEWDARADCHLSDAGLKRADRKWQGLQLACREA